MTLHWWMHWFWVTAQFFVILGNPVPSSTVEPQSQVQVHQDLKPASEIPSVEEEAVYTVNPTRQSFRVAKAIGLYPPTNTAVILNKQATTTVAGAMERTSTVEIVTPNNTSAAEDVHESISSTERVDVSKVSVSSRPENLERVRGSGVKKESKITWILTTNKTGRSKYEQEDKVQEAASRGRNTSSTGEVEDLTVLPLQEELSRVRLILNRTKPSAALVSSSSLSASADTLGSAAIRTFNRSDDDVEIDQELVEPQSFATAASILQVGVSESTRLSRARSAFPKDFQRDQVQGEDHLADYNESSSAEEPLIGSSSSHSAVDIAAITGSCLATVVILSTMGSLGFIMYRRRYLNPPQTLNSDKCSNPDSSGYIDDSTIRDNSEEMYSLDNDSFLNSLEAMTIQNYWTDSVKHTKL